ncbi:MAG: hypothetical protein M4579_001236 [Chaenotheca gracillima]|nr:MAG: hypothetical protein M4579_001236 [Chaenotheca gracillima]
MPPPRARTVVEDARSEASAAKDRQAPAGQSASATKSRRNGNNSAAQAGSSLKEATSANAVGGAAGNGAVSGSNGSNSQDGGNGIAWPALDTSVLHAYRHAYRLNTPSAFHSSLNQAILSNPGIGRMSPTMARRRERRRVSKDQLAMAVRKNFNGLGIAEGDVVVDFLYKVRWQDKSFRMRFTPPNLR